MKKLISFARFGSYYGFWAGVVVGILATLDSMAFTIYHWPVDGSISWFVEGTLSILIAFLIVGCILGSIGGIVFGLIGSVFNSILGWIISGIVGGFFSSWLFVLVLWLVKKPKFPNFLSFWFSLVWIGLLSAMVFGVIGWIIGYAIYRGRPNIPHLNRIRDQ